jgi:hypothetical protein
VPAFDRAGLIRAYLLVVAAGVSGEIAAHAIRRGRPARVRDVEPTTWLLHVLAQTLTAADYAAAVADMRRGASGGHFLQPP